MRTAWWILFLVLLLGPVSGCGSDSGVEVPENPAPKPEAKPVSTSGSLPADSDPGDSP